MIPAISRAAFTGCIIRLRTGRQTLIRRSNSYISTKHQFHEILSLCHMTTLHASHLHHSIRTAEAIYHELLTLDVQNPLHKPFMSSSSFLIQVPVPSHFDRNHHHNTTTHIITTRISHMASSPLVSLTSYLSYPNCSTRLPRQIPSPRPFTAFTSPIAISDRCKLCARQRHLPCPQRTSSTSAAPWPSSRL